MEFAKIVHLEDDLWAVNEIDKTIMYVINGAGKALLIDTGFGLMELPKLVKELCGEKEVYVINTHAHVDHNSGNNQFSQVHVGRFDEPYAHDLLTENEKSLFKEMFFQEILKEGFDFNEWNPGYSKEILTVKEGDIIDIGNYKFEVIEAPSHTLGSIVLWEQAKGWMFTGDIMLEWPVWGHLSNRILAPSVSLVNYYDSLMKLKQWLRCQNSI